MKIGLELFARIHRFKQLKIASKMKTLPDNGHIILGILVANEKQNNKKNISCTDIANELCVSTAAISRTIKNLRENNLISTQIDEKDRRNSIISLTDLGRQTLKNDCTRIENLMQKATQNISEKDLQHFFKIFDEIYNGVLSNIDKI